MEAADRKQMGKARAAHCVIVRLGDAILVAGGERGGNARFPAGTAELGADMGGKSLAQIGEAAGEAPLRGGCDHFDAERAAGAADLLEPGSAAEIIGAG